MTAYDKWNNYAWKKVDVLVDSEKPQINILAPENGSKLSGGSVTVYWSGWDDYEISKYEISVDGSPWIDVGTSTSYTITGLSEGFHTIYVRAWDFVGHYSIASVSIYIDLTPPIVTFLPAKLLVLRKSRSDNLLECDKYSQMSYSLDGGSWVPTNDTTVTLNYTEGKHVFKVLVVDDVGNSEVTSLVFYVDLTPPEIQILGPQNGSLIGEKEVPVRWIASDSGGVSHQEVMYNGTSYPAAGSVKLTLSEGINVIQI